MNSKIQNLESQIAEKIKSNNPENYTDLTLALLISVKIKSEAENDFSILRASKINSASTFNQNTLTLLNELKRESEELDARVKENEAAIKAANSKIESLSTQKSANTNKLSRITAYIEKYNTILKSHENDFPIFRKENIEKELNEKASVAELHDLIPDHNYKNWSGESAGALSSAMSKAKLELSKTAQRLQKSIDAISAGIQKANNIIDETSKRLADVNHDIAKIIEDAQSSLEYAKDDDNAPLKAVAPTPPEFITMIAPDENINRVLRAEAWKTNMDEYFTRRNRTYFIRDFIGNIVAKIVRFFGPTSYQSEYEKRHAFKADFNSALRVYAVDNNETVLRTAINTGLTHFKPGTDESSTAYFTTMKSHLETINQEFNDSLKP